MEDLCVDNLITEGDKITDIQTLKDTAIQIFKEPGFVLHKWHSQFLELEGNNPEQSSTELEENNPEQSSTELEENNPEQSSTEQTYVKQQLGIKSGKRKMLGIKWDKKKDNFNIEIPPPIQKITK